MDRKKILPVVEQLFDASLDSKCWADALESIAKNLSSPIGALYLYDTQSGLASFIAAVGLTRPWQLRYAGEFARHDDLLHDALDQPGQAIYTDANYPNAGAFLKSEIYTDFYKPTEGERVLICPLEQQERYAVICSFRRPLGRGEYSAAEIEYLQQLRPCLQKACRLQQHMDTLKSRLDDIHETVDRMQLPIVLLDTTNAVSFYNQAAKSILDKDCCIKWNDKNQLYCVKPADSKKLQAAIARVKSLHGKYKAIPVETLTLVCTKDACKFYVLVTTAFRQQWVKANSECSKASVALFIQPESTSIGDPNKLQNWFGLTDAEAELAGQLTLNAELNLRDLAKEMGLSYHTVRSHLKHIFSKTGFNNQAELVRGIMTTPQILQ